MYACSQLSFIVIRIRLRDTGNVSAPSTNNSTSLMRNRVSVVRHLVGVVLDLLDKLRPLSDKFDESLTSSSLKYRSSRRMKIQRQTIT